MASTIPQARQLINRRHMSEMLVSLAPNEKEILRGHSLGGINLALAMDKFPHKISVGVFLTAYMPDTTYQPSYVLDKVLIPQDNKMFVNCFILFSLQQFFGSVSAEVWSDTQFSPYGGPEQPLISVIFRPQVMSSYLYQQCIVEVTISLFL
ncbi:hypothetical protein CRYUN_Cryun24cG0023100 [Craigia yunnanensis]